MSPIARLADPVLLFSPSVDGGISEYMHAQANEMARRRLRVVMLVPSRFLYSHPDRMYQAAAILLAVPDALRPALLRRALFGLYTVLNQIILALFIVFSNPKFILLDSMNELFSPFWSWPHIFLARKGVIYAATLHDPVRDRKLGTEWWHQLSLRLGYAPLTVGLVHSLPIAEQADVPRHVRIVEVPHGIFPIAQSAPPATCLRVTLGIPASATVALSFGYVVDRKNLGLVIEALQQMPNLHVIVAGRRGSAHDRSPASYVTQAESLGVSDRCHFVDRFIGDGELDDFFRAADFLLMTYTGAFVSQSGVLHVAANWNLPVLASGGPGPLVDTVRQFGLGRVVDPDSLEALVRGMQQMISEPPDGRAGRAAWKLFRENASWKRNVDLLLAAVESVGRRDDA